MINLPFQMNIDFIVEKSGLDEFVFNKLFDELQGIMPEPVVSFYINSLEEYTEIKKLLQSKKNPFQIILKYNPEISEIPFNDISVQIPSNISSLAKIVENIANKTSNSVIIEIVSDEQGYENYKKEILRVRNINLNNIFIHPYLTENEVKNYFCNVLNRPFLTCAAPWLNPIIHSNGDVYCCKYNCIGNIKENELLDLWNNQKADDIRKSLCSQKNLSACVKCSKKYDDTFLIVEQSRFVYKNKIYNFASEINYTKSAPKLAVIGNEKDENSYDCSVVPVFRDEDLINLTKSQKVIMLLE